MSSPAHLQCQSNIFRGLLPTTYILPRCTKEMELTHKLVTLSAPHGRWVKHPRPVSAMTWTSPLHFRIFSRPLKIGTVNASHKRSDSCQSSLMRDPVCSCPCQRPEEVHSCFCLAAQTTVKHTEGVRRSSNCENCNCSTQQRFIFSPCQVRENTKCIEGVLAGCVDCVKSLWSPVKVVSFILQATGRPAPALFLQGFPLQRSITLSPPRS